ncbi:protein toll-like [Penaeus indicus]|uniref:protein toll-like n=1 Tax=Penaeus indicus TaxID=29960 RepID=UPI00300C9ACF
MKPLWLLLPCLLVVSSMVAEVSGFSQCGKCVQGQNQLICPNLISPERFEVTIEDHNGTSESVFHLKCQHRAKWVDFSLIDDCSFPDVKYVIFERCPRPNVTFAEVFRGSGIKPEGVLSFTFSAVFTGQPSEDLEEWHFQGLSNLTGLKLRGNNFQSLPPNVLQYTPKLTYFQLSYNNIPTISETLFQNTTQLKTIHLMKNGFTHLPEGLFKNLNKLTNISLWDNNIERIGPKLFQNLPSLWSLELSYNNISTLDPDVFASIPNAGKILLLSNRIENLPEHLFRNCTNLEYVNMNDNRITSLPSELFRETKKIYSIELNNNMISSLPEDLFKGLSKLGKLKMKRNALKTLPSGLLSDLSKLEVLDLQSNVIEELPSGFLDSQQIMDILILKNNSLAELPEGIFKNCAGLHQLYMSHNKFSSLQSSWFPAPVTTLRELDLESNNISFSFIASGQGISVEENFPLLSQVNLEKIKLGYNRITAIPQAFSSNFVNLTELSLTHNDIEFVDASDLIFKSDEVALHLENNKIRTIDLQQIQNIVSYKVIDLFMAGNQLLCDCNLYWFLAILQGKHLDGEVPQLKVIRPEELNCVYAGDETTVKPLLRVSSEMLTCRLQDCSERCKCYTRPHDNMYIVDCAYQKLHDIPRIISQEEQNLHNYSLTLNLRNNSISNLDQLQNPEYRNLVNLTIPNNYLVSLNESILPDSLRVLDIHGNKFTYLEPSVVDYFNKTDITLSLGENPWVCDCKLTDLQSFLRSQELKVLDFHNIRCMNFNETLGDVTEGDMCPIVLPPEVIIASTVISMFLILSGVLATVSFWKYKEEIKVWLFTHRLCLWAVAHEEYDNNKKYDAFISYSNKDEEFVNTVLVPGLESGDPKYKVCLHYRDWLPGAYIQQQITQSVEASRRTIVVLSSNFIENVWGHLEFKTAHCQALKDRHNRVIVIVLGEVPPENELDEELKLYLSTRTYLQFGDSKFWEKLRYAMPHPYDLIYKKQRKRRDTDKLELVKSDSKESK